ncbi:MAG: HAD family hydrolase [Clostridia bacterium]|nr:HAD family hydrolase [Clostridia bacterium]
MDKDNRTILILDYDGTLHNSVVIYEPAFRKVMAEISEMGWIEKEEYSSEEITYWVGFSAKEMWEKFHPELSDEQKSYAGRRIGQYMLKDVADGRGKLYDGALETLEALSKKYKLVFFSNCNSEYAEVHKKAFGLDRFIEEFWCTGDYGFKQKEEVFAEHIYQPGRHYIIVGDRIKDMNLAKSCGMPFVGCLYGFGTEKELEGADYLIGSISELSKILG